MNHTLMHMTTDCSFGHSGKAVAKMTYTALKKKICSRTELSYQDLAPIIGVFCSKE
jgi:hypothetical protein